MLRLEIFAREERGLDYLVKATNLNYNTKSKIKRAQANSLGACTEVGFCIPGPSKKYVSVR